MSVLLKKDLAKTDLTEYARQCTLQRRRYEECVQEAQRSGMTQATAASACSIAHADIEVPTETTASNEGAEQPAHSCLADLLGLSVEPLAWDDQQVAAPTQNNGVTETPQWRGNRAQSTQQPTSSVPKNVSSVSYGAP